MIFFITFFLTSVLANLDESTVEKLPESVKQGIYFGFVLHSSAVTSPCLKFATKVREVSVDDVV